MEIYKYLDELDSGNIRFLSFTALQTRQIKIGMVEYPYNKEYIYVDSKRPKKTKPYISKLTNYELYNIILDYYKDNTEDKVIIRSACGEHNTTYIYSLCNLINNNSWLTIDYNKAGLDMFHFRNPNSESRSTNIDVSSLSEDNLNYISRFFDIPSNMKAIELSIVMANNMLNLCSKTYKRNY